MDSAVALLQTCLRVNGYFTVSEYPIVELRGAFQAATDMDVLAFRFRGAERWVTLAGRAAQAGADGAETNLGVFRSDAEDSGDALERSMSAVVQAVREAVDVPVAAKLGPSFTSFGDAASAPLLEPRGASGAWTIS